jgi:uncharacterized protein YyaL (SSP411 family)
MMNLPLMCQLLFTHFFNKNRKSISRDDAIKLAIEWLCTAQDTQHNGGVSLRYSIRTNWDSSYPETTGYIIPTFFKYSDVTNNEEYRKRAIKMAEWEISIQDANGSFYGGPYGNSKESFVFDTGQIIFGLLEAFKRDGRKEFLQAALRAADWLIKVQDPDGKWSKHAYNSIPHSYYSRVAWALCELGKSTGNDIYVDAAVKNIKWTLNNQMQNGWFDCAGFTKEMHYKPYTHTIAYTIRGILETGICIGNQDYISSAQRAADSLINVIYPSGYLSGGFDKKWTSDFSFSCLTGNAQMAIIFFRLFEITKEKKYLLQDSC